MDVLLGLMPDSAASAEESERLTRRLRAELREAHLHSSLPPQPAAGQPTEIHKGAGADVVTAGAVVLALSAPGGVLTSLVALVQDWLGRQSAGNRVSVTIDGDTIEVAAATPEQQQLLIDAFVQRHSAGGQ